LSVRDWCPSILTGFVQPEDYARELLSVHPDVTGEVVAADKDTGLDPDMAWVGDRLMFVVGYTSGGAPYGCYVDEMEDPF
jgi:hypothetical protein